MQDRVRRGMRGGAARVIPGGSPRSACAEGKGRRSEGGRGKERDKTVRELKVEREMEKREE